MTSNFNGFPMLFLLTAGKWHISVCRLTPALMFVILFVVNLEPFIDKGPLWELHNELQACDEYWWTNLLYINNFYPTNPAKGSVMSTTDRNIRNLSEYRPSFVF